MVAVRGDVMVANPNRSVRRCFSWEVKLVYRAGTGAGSGCGCDPDICLVKSQGVTFGSCSCFTTMNSSLAFGVVIVEYGESNEYSVEFDGFYVCLILG